MSLQKRSWLALIATAIATFNSGALFFGYPGVLTPWWGEKFGANNSQTGFIMTFACLGVGLLMLVSGFIHAKIGTRKCIMIGSAILIGAMLLANAASSIYHAFLWAFLCGAGNGFVYGPCIGTCQQWMPTRRGLASGVVNLTFGTAGAIMSIVYTKLLYNESIGYTRMNWIIIGMLIILNSISVIFAEMPSFTHLTAEQEKELEEQKQKASQKSIQSLSARSFTVKEALKTKFFWLLWLSWLFMGAAGISMVSLAGKYAISIGLTSSVVLTAFNITNGVGRIIAGTLSDKIGGNLTGLIILVIGGIGYLCLPFFTNIVPVAVFSAFVGLAFGTLFTVTAPLVSGLFGLKNYSMIFSLIFSAYGFLSGVLGPFLSGKLLDISDNNYSIVFRLLSIFCFVGAICIFFAKKDRVK